MKLTVAVICKNEEKNIGRCLTSIFHALRQIGASEVLVVDSFSTDNTIGIASRYPVKIVRLGEDWPHSPAAGRYTAFVHARGEYTLSIDADMTLAEGFLEKALPFMDECPRAAGTTGIIKHTVLSTADRECLNVDGGLLPLKGRRFEPLAPGLIRSLPGAGLFRTKDVLEAGNFHPFLRSEEEYELCQRLRKAGNELWYLPCRIADHYGYSGDGTDEIKRRWKRGFMKGIGEMFRLSMSYGFLTENLERFRQHLIIGGYIILAPLFLSLGFLHTALPVLWGGGLLLVAAAFSLRKGSLTGGLNALVYKALIGLCIYGKMFSRIPSAAAYPAHPVIMDFTGSSRQWS